MPGSSLRTAGVGLFLAMALAYHFQIDFLNWTAHSQTILRWEFAYTAMAGVHSGQLLGLGDYFVIAYLVACLGAGLFLAGLLWPSLDETLIALLNLPAHLLFRLIYRLQGYDTHA